MKKIEAAEVMTSVTNHTQQHLKMTKNEGQPIKKRH